MRYFLFACLLILGCTKKNNTPRTGLAGAWEHVERYSDIGNGTGSWSAVPPADRTVIVFQDNGGLNAGSYGQLVSFDRYEVINPSSFRAFNASGQTKEFGYVLGTDLIISYTCREQCRDRFRRKDR